MSAKRNSFIASAIGMSLLMTSCGTGSASPSDFFEKAEDDVVKIDCESNFFRYETFPEVRIMNHSSKTSDYQVTVTYTSESGVEKYDDSTIEVRALEPGQFIRESGTGVYLSGADPYCEVTKIVRTPVD